MICALEARLICALEARLTRALEARLARRLALGRGMTGNGSICRGAIRGDGAGFVSDDSAASGLVPAAVFVDATIGAHCFDDVAGSGGDGFGLLHDVGEGVFGLGGANLE